ncbi:hypothetical protein FOZ62_023828 [Perkinsus olseni]|uniref:NADP-dependent 3-hydroxy acid dehydrogenase YdfG n=1 Tax=Perkinsus olseni TaxID=32597 RepID=A0A7J6QCJ2_PEROL|nr:hypothetical protein FOZ62_023828 [Perkinsus olseni]
MLLRTVGLLSPTSCHPGPFEGIVSVDLDVELQDFQGGLKDSLETVPIPNGVWPSWESDCFVAAATPLRSIHVCVKHSGIGEGFARRLAAEGCKVALAARREDRLNKIVDELKQKGLTAMAVATDVSSQDSVKSLFASVEAQLGPVDIVVNCAGVMYFTLHRSQHWDEWERTIDINCKGVVYTSGAVLPSMLERKVGHIINISSDAATTIFPALSVYNASKAFVHVFSKSLRGETVGTGIRVTELQPGDVGTDLVVNNTDTDAANTIGVTIGKTIDGGGDRNAVLDVSDIVDAGVFALTAPPHVGVNEILIEPRNQMYGDPTAINATD